MGIRGLNSFVEKYPIQMREEINLWKRTHSGMRPIILIDFKNLTYAVKTSKDSDICGGNPQLQLQTWKHLLDAFKTLECDLIFFADLVTPMWKANEWMKRQDEGFERNQMLYGLIERGMTLEDISKNIHNLKSLNATYIEMSNMAKEYGVFHYSIENDNDLEIAHYAKKNDVFAVISKDSDFLIYDGSWKLWGDLDVNEIIDLRATEFDKKSLLKRLKLPRHKMPLFATLAGNDFTKNKFLNINRNYYHIANYVRKLKFNGILDFNIKQVAIHDFGSDSKENCQLIENSVNSYNADRSLEKIDDPLAKKLFKTPIYQSYMALTYPIIGIPMPYYDMGGRHGNLLTELIIDWTNRKKGILLMERRPETRSYTLLAKKEPNRNFEQSTENIIYPEFRIPPLEQLYLGNTLVHNAELDEKRWEILQYINSFSDEEILKIKGLDKQFRLICTILYVLVKKGILSVIEADGIMFTEYRVYNGTKNNRKPTKTNVEHIRSAHIYVITFQYVRENFAIAGLFSMIQDKLQFNGVYYQQLMQTFVRMSDADRQEYMNSLQKLRIYA